MPMHADIDVTLSRIRDVLIEHGAPGDTWAKVTVFFGNDSLVVRVCDEATADELSDAFAEAGRRLNRRDAAASVTDCRA